MGNDVAAEEVTMDIKLVDVTVHIDEALDHARLQQLSDRLRAENGVVTVSFHDDKPHLFIVGYDPERTDSQAILRCVQAQQVHAELVGL
jgi:hypothetical protein